MHKPNVPVCSSKGKTPRSPSSLIRAFLSGSLRIEPRAMIARDSTDEVVFPGGWAATGVTAPDIRYALDGNKR
jgi:hypothetical protein